MSKIYNPDNDSNLQRLWVEYSYAALSGASEEELNRRYQEIRRAEAAQLFHKAKQPSYDLFTGEKKNWDYEYINYAKQQLMELRQRLIAAKSQNKPQSEIESIEKRISSLREPLPFRIRINDAVIGLFSITFAITRLSVKDIFCTEKGHKL